MITNHNNVSSISAPPTSCPFFCSYFPTVWLCDCNCDILCRQVSRGASEGKLHTEYNLQLSLPQNILKVNSKFITPASASLNSLFLIQFHILNGGSRLNILSIIFDPPPYNINLMSRVHCWNVRFVNNLSLMRRYRGIETLSPASDIVRDNMG